MATGLFRMQHGPSGPAIGQLDVREHQYALWIGLNPLKVCWGRSRTPPASMSAASRGRCRGSSRGCCGRLCGTRRAGHGPRGPLGPVGCGGGRGAPPCASHRPISTLERPSPAPWAAPEACLGIRKCNGPFGPWWVYGLVRAAVLRERPLPCVSRTRVYQAMHVQPAGFAGGTALISTAT